MEIAIEHSKILAVQCHDCITNHDCIAAAGGCKHALTLLGWMYRKSEQIGVTEVEAYWKKSSLSKVGDVIVSGGLFYGSEKIAICSFKRDA